MTAPAMDGAFARVLSAATDQALSAHDVRLYAYLNLRMLESGGAPVEFSSRKAGEATAMSFVAAQNSLRQLEALGKVRSRDGRKIGRYPCRIIESIN